MKNQATFQLRGYLSSHGNDDLDALLVHCARLYNAALEEWRAAWKMQGVGVTYYDQCKGLTGVRADDPKGWGNRDVKVGRGVLIRLDRARKAFYRRVRAGEKPGYPRFKPSHRWKSIELEDVTPSMVQAEGDKATVRIKGVPTIRLLPTRPLPPSGDLKAIRIVRRGQRVEVNLTYEVEREPLTLSEAQVGIDMGISDRLTLSTGETIGRADPQAEEVAKAQRRLARTRKGSRRHKRRVRVLANRRSRAKVRNRNECHRVTSEIVKRFGHIAVEKLDIENMTRSAKGTIEAPGTNVKAKSGLNRAIREQTWEMMRQQLRYKAEWAGREYVEVDPRGTSQTCSRCGVVDGESRRGKVYACRACGHVMDAALNAAVNILG